MLRQPCFARLASVALVLAAALPGRAMERVLFAHNPALSPDGRRVAFDWKGDVWIVPVEGGLATALTYHPDQDGNPCFSPDGEQLVWTSNRSGNWDIYISTSYGSEPRRLTYQAGSDGASAFTPDGQGVIFASSRYQPAWADGGGSRPLFPNRQEFVVPVAGGTPTQLQKGLGSVGRLSPDGKQLVFVRGGVSDGRRGYRGPANDDLWLHDLEADTYTQLTDFEGADSDPCWSNDGRSIYFVSDRDGVRNLWQLPLDGGQPQQVTRHATPVDSPSIARNVPRLVYECDDQLYLLELGNQPEPILIGAPADDAEQTMLWQTYSNNCSEFAVAPSGKEVAFVVRGDIYVARFPAGGYTRRLTNTPSREGGLCWTSDSKTLWYQADPDRQYDLYTVTSGDEDEPRLRHTTKLVTTNLTRSEVDESTPQISPDGKRVVFVRDKGDIVVADLDLQNEQVLSRHWSYPRVAWAPTSDWLAFSRTDEDFNSDVFIIPAAGGDPVNVSQHPAADWYPAWAGDGSKLAFLSSRSGDQTDIYYVWLRHTDWERTKADRAFDEDLSYDKPKSKPEPKPDEPKKDDEAKPDEAKPKEEAPKEPEPKKDPEPKKTAIDLAQIHERLVRLTRTVDHEDWVSGSPDGKTFAYTLNGGLHTIGWENPEAKQIAGGVGPSQLTYSADGKRIDFVRSGGNIATVGAGGGSVSTVEFAAEVERDLQEERLYVFDAVWRIMRDDFYDPKMHGADWNAARERHLRRAELAPTERDFESVVNDLLGELNSSHMGYSRGYAAPKGEPAAGELGITWSDDRPAKGLKVDAVVPGSPASKAESKIEAGETVLAVDGVELTPTVNVWSLLTGKTGERVKLQVAAADGQEREVIIRPANVRDIGQWRYEAFVAGERQRAEELSQGQVGYLHIRSMDQPSLEDFERDLFAAGHGRKALIIDVRWNGGGWIADNLLGMLMVEPHAYTIPRDGHRGYPTDRRMAPAWSGPTVLMANATSVSNAEILAHAFKTLGRGPVVGETTYGGVISTGSATLVDGSRVRLPGRGWYRIGDGQNMEHHGAEPDIAVAFGPADEAAGRDPQLEAAVKAALELIAGQGE